MILTLQGNEMTVVLLKQEYISKPQGIECFVFTDIRNLVYLCFLALVLVPNSHLPTHP